MKKAQQKPYKVLLLGDSCTDIYYNCRSTRKNPESDAPLVKIGGVYLKQGMGANVRQCLENLGLKVKFLTNDADIRKTRYIDVETNKQLLRVDFEPPYTAIKEIDLSEVKWHKYSAVVISDYCKGAISDETIHTVIDRFSHGPIFLDTKKTYLKDYKGCIIKINEPEFKAAYLSDELDVVITLGGDGSQYSWHYEPALEVDCVDVCGAGDSYLAGLVYGYSITKNIVKSMRFATVCAGISVQHVGTYAPTKDEVEDLL